MVCLSWGKFVEWSKINHAAGTSVRFWTYGHTMAPHHWVAVTVQAPLDISLPVNGYLAGSVDSARYGILLYKDTQWRGLVHKVQWLLFTAVECTAGVPLQDVLLEDWQVLWGWRTRKLNWCGWWRSTRWTTTQCFIQFWNPCVRTCSWLCTCHRKKID